MFRVSGLSLTSSLQSAYERSLFVIPSLILNTPSPLTLNIPIVVYYNILGVFNVRRLGRGSILGERIKYLHIEVELAVREKIHF